MLVSGGTRRASVGVPQGIPATQCCVTAQLKFVWVSGLSLGESVAVQQGVPATQCCVTAQLKFVLASGFLGELVEVQKGVAVLPATQCCVALYC